VSQGTIRTVTTPDLEALGRRVAAAARQLAGTSGATRSEALRRSAVQLRSASAAILTANEADLAQAEADGLPLTALDRLRLDEARVEAMAAGLEAVAALPDPVGEVLGGSVRPNGLRVSQIRVPLGVVGVIYENRPNVTSDVAGLCLKSGNAAFLRGSSSALRSNKAIVDALRAGLDELGIPVEAVSLVEDISHEAALAFMKLRGLIDLLIPRGGPSLIASMLEHATVPYVIDGDGNCHVYVDAAADLDMALDIIVNAKTQRPGVCNAAESILIDRPVAEELLGRLRRAMPTVALRGDEAARRIDPSIEPASEDDYGREFLDLIASVKIVDGVDEAIAHIARYSSGHSEAIVTADITTAERFLDEVDAAAVLLNASTRFVDGAELGLGAEVGISTQKLHARGPMGLTALTSVKWVIRGEGQTRT